MVKSRFKKIAAPQITLIFILTLLIFIINYSFYLTVTFLLLALLTTIWVFLAIRTVRHDYNELGFGILTLTIHFPIIVISSTNIPDEQIKQLLLIWWLFAGIANATTIRVGSMRGKITNYTPFARTILFTASFMIFRIWVQIHWIFYLTLIEPIIQNFRQFKNHQIIDPKLVSIKKIGYNLMVSLILAICILLIGIYFQFR